MADDIYDRVTARKVSDLIPDDLNANQGTERGDFMLTQSLQKFGAGRSILLDKNGRIIAGNKTQAKFGDLGLEDVIVVQTDGKQLVAVQRTDIDLDSPAGRELALADNRVGEVNLSWDTDALAAIGEEIDLTPWFTADEIEGWGDEVPDFDEDPDSSAREIDVDAMEFDCKCPKCGFEFIKTNL
jgi:hypothetical protein